MKILSFDVGIVNLAYCIFDTSLKKILDWEVITLGSTVNYNSLYINLITQLDARNFMLNVDTVIIEKQPSFNPKMRIISGCLQTYFIIRGMVDTTVIKSVDFFSPKHKLKCYTGNQLVIDSKAKSKYSQTKKMGILICREKLHEFNETDEHKKQFEQSKKKDDLADCYLQAITFSLFKKYIPGSVTISEQIAPPPKIGKLFIKKQIKDYLDPKIGIGKLSAVEIMNLKNDTTGSKILLAFNDMGSNLKDSINSKFNITFPVDYLVVSEILGDIGMKSYLNKNFI
jgi:hypothetical protein